MKHYLIKNNLIDKTSYAVLELTASAANQTTFVKKTQVTSLNIYRYSILLLSFLVQQ